MFIFQFIVLINIKKWLNLNVWRYFSTLLAHTRIYYVVYRSFIKYSVTSHNNSHMLKKLQKHL